MRRMEKALDLVRDALVGTVRTLRRSPGFALGVVLTLGLGLGANAAMFGIVDRLLLRPPDGIVAPEEVRLVGLTRGEPGQSFTQYSLTYPDLLDIDREGGLPSVAGYGYPDDVTVGSGAEATSVQAQSVSHDFFAVLGVEPAVGRFWTPDEDRVDAAGTVVLSWDYWRTRHGADPGVLGRTLEVGGSPHTVIGVAPRGVTGVELQPVDLWLPIEPTQTATTGGTGWRDSRFSWWVRAVARAPDSGARIGIDDRLTSITRAAGGDESVQARREDQNWRVELTPLLTPDDSDEAGVVKWLVGVSLIVLLVACANVANLFLARASKRRREVGVRLAMGVSRARLVGQMALESVLLASLGGAVALLLAWWGGEGLRRALLPNVHFPDAVDGRVLLFTGAISVLAGLLAGLGPALQSTRLDLGGALKEGDGRSSSGGSRARGGLVIAQAALSVVLLVGAGLFVKSLDSVRSMDLGLDVDRLLMARLELEAASPSPREAAEIHRQALERVRSIPGVEGATVTQAPLGWGFSVRLRVPGVDSIPRMPGGGPYYWSVDEEYFETVGLELEAGRTFSAADAEGAPRVALVSRSMADSVWGGDAALGECMQVGVTDGEETPCTTVVGIVEDAHRGGYEEEAFLAYYLPLEQRLESDRAQGLYVRASGSPEAIAGEVALTLRSFSTRVRYARVQTLREVLDPRARSWSLGATMFSLFGLLAVVVAAVGLYSLLAFDVAERRRELGIRMALGAAAARLVRDVVAQASRLLVVGVVLGLAGAWILAPRIEELLFEVDPHDPAVLAGVAGVLALVGLVATAIPARRATGVNPSEALRQE